MHFVLCQTYGWRVRTGLTKGPIFVQNAEEVELFTLISLHVRNRLPGNVRFFPFLTFSLSLLVTRCDSDRCMIQLIPYKRWFYCRSSVTLAQLPPFVHERWSERSHEAAVSHACTYYMCLPAPNKISRRQAVCEKRSEWEHKLPPWQQKVRQTRYQRSEYL